MFEITKTHYCLRFSSIKLISCCIYHLRSAKELNHIIQYEFFAQNVVKQIHFPIACEFYQRLGIFIGCIAHKKQSLIILTKLQGTLMLVFPPNV